MPRLAQRLCIASGCALTLWACGSDDADGAGTTSSGGPTASSSGAGSSGSPTSASSSSGAPTTSSSGSSGAPTDPCTSTTPERGDFSWTVESGGMTRTFLVHVPARYEPTRPSPLVLDFHGRGSNAGQEILISGMRTKADAEGFVAVHAEGYEATWNAGACCGGAQTAGIDDVAFTRLLIDEVERHVCIDAKRVFATGLSNGGMISYRLACELSDRIAAVAPVAGTMESLLSVGCAPTRAVSVMHFHGTGDNIVPYGGYVQSVPDGVAGWAQRNGCGSNTSVTFQAGDTSCATYTGCANASEVTLCTVTDGGHQWPGSDITIPGLGKTTQAIEATDAMWSFFAAHPMP